MSYTYTAYISINDTDGRSINFTESPTVTAWDGRTKAAITTPSPTLTNITTGLYSVDIELATKTDVLFKIVPHADDEEDIQDIKVIHEGYIETVEMMGNGVTLISAYDAAKTAASQSSVEAIPTNPLLADDYVAPDNASIAAIDNKMDNLPTREYADELKDEVIEAIDDKPVTPVTDISDLPTKTDLATAKDAIIDAMPDIDISTIPDDILSTVVVDDMTVAQVLKVLSAVEVGTVEGGGGATFSYMGKDGTKITLSGVDENGNRGAVNVEFE